MVEWGEHVTGLFVKKVYDFLDILPEFPDIGTIENKEKYINEYALPKNFVAIGSGYLPNIKKISEDLKKDIEKVLGKEKKELRIEIREIKNVWTSAALSGQWIAQQIEKRMPHRRVMKQAMEKIMANKEVKGGRIELSGRLGGNEIARREWLRKGRLPLQTLRAVIDYALTEALCTYGLIGIKVWIYKGEKFD